MGLRENEEFESGVDIEDFSSISDTASLPAKKSKKTKASKASSKPAVTKKKVSSEKQAVNSSVEAAEPLKEGCTALEDLSLLPQTIDALIARGINYLFPIQSATYKLIFEGKDVIGRARTGQGKTLAFCLPIYEKLCRANAFGKSVHPKVLIMSPTRELAKQIVAEFVSIAPSLRIEALYGGVPLTSNQTALRKGIDVVVGTPGRIKDLLERQWLSFSEVSHVVLDEADQMLDMGFQDEVQLIFDNVTAHHQTCLFSATMPPWVHTLSNKYMKEDRVVVDLVGSEKQKAGITVRHVAVPTHWTMLGSTVNAVIAMFGGRDGRVILFCPTKLDCDTIAMDSSIKYESQVLHGDIPQAKRESTLAAYKEGRFRLLIATDVAARGLDLSVELVIQSKPPIRQSGKPDVETYVHRSGRTGRAGKRGICVTLWTPKVKYALEDIEKAVGNKFEWMGAPQPKDVLQCSAQQYAEDAATVSEEVLPYYEDTAKMLLAQMGAEKALCALLAQLTGFVEKPASRSLLSSQDKMVTFQFNSRNEIGNHSYVFGSLRRHLPEDLMKGIRGMRLTKDKMGACFDVEEAHMSTMTKLIDGITGYKWLQVCETLPPLQEDNKPAPTPTFQGRGGGRGFGGGRGGSGGRQGFSGRGGGSFGGGRGDRAGFGGKRSRDDNSSTGGNFKRQRT